MLRGICRAMGDDRFSKQVILGKMEEVTGGGARVYDWPKRLRQEGLSMVLVIYLCIYKDTRVYSPPFGRGSRTN